MSMSEIKIQSGSKSTANNIPDDKAMGELAKPFERDKKNPAPSQSGLAARSKLRPAGTMVSPLERPNALTTVNPRDTGSFT